MGEKEERSLIARARADELRSPLLFSELSHETLERIEQQERGGEWTGERLWTRNRQVYETIVRMIAADFPDVTVAQLLGVSTNTIAAVRQREGESIEDCKKRMLPLMQRTRERLLHRIFEEAPTMAGDKAAVAFGIVSDKLALESGAPTQRIEITGVPAVEEYRQWIQEKVLDGCVEVVPGTGCEGCVDLQRGASGAPGAEAATGASGGQVDGGEMGTADRQSDVSQGEGDGPTGEATDGGPIS